jgi:hypothetical protein
MIIEPTTMKKGWNEISRNPPVKFYVTIDVETQSAESIPHGPHANFMPSFHDTRHQPDHSQRDYRQPDTDDYHAHDDVP